MSYDICIGFNLVNNTNVNILFTFVKNHIPHSEHLVYIAH